METGEYNHAESEHQHSIIKKNSSLVQKLNF